MNIVCNKCNDNGKHPECAACGRSLRISRRDPNTMYEEYDSSSITNMWEHGQPHHPKSVELMKHLDHLDWKCLSGYFDFRTGGDGDNGETLMYLLDIYFENN